MKHHHRILRLAVLLISGLVTHPAAAEPPSRPSIPLDGERQFHIFVSSTGHDGDLGNREKPFASLERARDEIRRIKDAGPLPDGGITVEVAGGTYERTSSFELTEADSGTARSPVLYRARQRESVQLVGGRPVGDWLPVTDLSVLERMDPEAGPRILQADLRAQGIENFGGLSRRGPTLTTTQGALELFFADQAMTLARWPNQGWSRIVGTPDGQYGGKFNYDGDRPIRWSQAEDLWLHGYWTFAWADSYEKVNSIDTAKRLITTEAPHGIHGYTPERRFRALNLLEELDEPGEWYLNRQTGILYFWPPAPITKNLPVVSLLETPMLTLTGTSFITVRGISFECARGSGAVVAGGTNNQIIGCTFRHLGTFAASIGEGRATTGSGITGCDIYGTGEGGIRLDGGDRLTLEPGGNFALNNHIHHYSRWIGTYQPAISAKGVGQRIAHNLIHDAPHIGIYFTGNDHLIEFNDISRVCLETGDAGAVYTGCDLTARGTVIRYNRIHDIARKLDAKDGWVDVMSVYLDDCTSGITVSGNIFLRGGRAVLIGGGRDNLIENNIFVDCNPAIHVDGRAQNWMKANFFAPNGPIMAPLKAVPYDRPPYSTRYPNLASILIDEPALPKYNRILRNICVGEKWIDWHAGADDTLVEVRDNLIAGDPRFINPAIGDFHLLADSPALKLGFQPIPVGKIGLIKDDTRASHVLTPP